MNLSCRVEDCEESPDRVIHVGFAGETLEVEVCNDCYREMGGRPRGSAGTTTSGP